jgi:hypothetical protein
MANDPGNTNQGVRKANAEEDASNAKNAATDKRADRITAASEKQGHLKPLPPRKPVPPPVEITEYPEGDPDKGRIDFAAQGECLTEEVIPMRDRRAYLLEQAQRNQDANDELNAIQVEQNRNVQRVQSELQDPDYMRETSMETAVEALKSHDAMRSPEYIKKMRKLREDRRKEAVGAA